MDVRRSCARPLAVVLVASGLVPLASLTQTAAAAVPTRPFLAEIHYDNAGTDSGKFVEVQLPPGTSTAGWTVVLYNGSGGAAYRTSPLPAVAAPAGAPAVAVLDYPVDGVQNGSPDGVALVDQNGAVFEFLSYDRTFTAVDGPAGGTISTDIGVAETATTPVGSSLSRTYDAASDSYV